MVPIVPPLRSAPDGDQSLQDVPIVQPLRFVQAVTAVQGSKVKVQNNTEEVCLGCLGEPFINFLLEGEELLDARALLHALEMRRDVGEA